MKKERETAERPLEERGQWGSKVEFLLAVAGNVVGLGNVWRFPYLCYKNGGGAFLVPYLLFVVICGIPLFLLETAMGQYTQEGGITCWRKLCPLAEGIGYAGQLILFYSCMCYIIILAWALFYLYFSFSSQLPWASCSNTWNSGLTLPGALQGVVFYLYPDPSHLTDPQVWMEAGSQIFFSYSLGVGTLTVLGSYNTYNNNCYKDCLWLCLLNSGTSVVAGFAVFSVLGFMAHEQGVAIEEVAESGPGLAFIAYPQAVAMMPLPQLWATCFFIMIILLGLDTQFVAMEAVMTTMKDLFPTVLRRAGHREIFLLLFCLTCFVLQLVMVTQGSFIFSVVEYQPLTFNRWYVYPDWAYVLGWLLALSSVVLVRGGVWSSSPSALALSDR
ncbi:hypothetical protein ANANG_G00236740 [Anguilla anguilla]|uniref:Transporter n=1 Tax=Anguilla anguilla TaxID=7936 RepID=A0A9D3LUF8_ANGAN|nr:hypothetical protein ANANG_G00236740 [Anguilla anguilla]